jgi:hypothetical protein
MHLNLKPLVFRGTKGELIHVPCGLFRSTLDRKGGADYWDIECTTYEMEIVVEKLEMHYSSFEMVEQPTVGIWHPKHIAANSKELGFIDLHWNEHFRPKKINIIDDWKGGMSIPDFTDNDGMRYVFRCLPANSRIIDGLHSLEELNYPNNCAQAKPATKEELEAIKEELEAIKEEVEGPYYVGWTVDEEWIIDEDDDSTESRGASNEEIDDLKEKIVQLEKSNIEIKSILELILKSSNISNITYNIQDNAITGSIDIDENSD